MVHPAGKPYRAYLLTVPRSSRSSPTSGATRTTGGSFRKPELTDVVPVHAYSHVNTFSSAAMVYAVWRSPVSQYLRQRLRFPSGPSATPPAATAPTSGSWG